MKAVPETAALHLTGQHGEIEHFIYGSAKRRDTLSTVLTDDFRVRQIKGGIVLRQTLQLSGDSVEAAAQAVEAMAQAHGLSYDGWGAVVDDVANIVPLNRTPVEGFRNRTELRAGQWFGFALENRHLGHARFLGEDKNGHLLLDISALTGPSLATAAQIAQASRLYRQPILVWPSQFDVFAVSDSTDDRGVLPLEVLFRSDVGWPDPEVVEGLGQSLGLPAGDTPEAFNLLLQHMAQNGLRMPDIETFSIMTARVTRSGKMRLVDDHIQHHKALATNPPMPWQPVWMDELVTALSGGPDMIAIRDQVL